MKTTHHSQTITLPRRSFVEASAAPTVAEPDVPVDEVCDLLAAAGPLTVDNIAAGLNIGAQRVSACVRWMLSRDLLRQDEFERYRAWGPCAQR